MEVSMKRLFRGVTIATCRKGVTKLRFCEDVDVRLKHMRKDNPRQGFVIHDIMRFPEGQQLTKDQALMYMLEHSNEFTYPDAKSMIEKSLGNIKRLGKLSLDNERKLHLLTIAQRPKITQLSTNQVMDIIDDLV